MHSIVRRFVLVAGLAFVAAACGKGDACGELKQKVAASTGAAVDKVGALI